MSSRPLDPYTLEVAARVADRYGARIGRESAIDDRDARDGAKAVAECVAEDIRALSSAPFSKCSECDGVVMPVSRPSRTMPYQGTMRAVPATLAIPTCLSCGEEEIDEETARILDAALESVPVVSAGAEIVHEIVEHVRMMPHSVFVHLREHADAVKWQRELADMFSRLSATKETK